MALQLAWNLDHTSSSAVQVAKGLLHAATTDNVQPLAIMACEQFGNTLAASRDTLRKIEHCVVPTPQPAMLNFLKCTVGYSKNDCASYLGQSLAGLHFLTLAATLVTWKDQFKAVEALHDMVNSTATDKTLVPTVRQVKDLLARIEPRCQRSGFAEEVAGWQMLLDRSLTLRKTPVRSKFDTWSAPSPQNLGSLVNALRQLSRVGNADITRITIQTSKCAAWTIAFVKWSLGCPPSVVYGNTIVPSLEQADSKVTVIIPNNETPDTAFVVQIYSSIHSPTLLVSPGWKEPAVGMISLQCYGQSLLHEYGFDSGVMGAAFREAIPYCLCLAMAKLSTSFRSAKTDQSHTTVFGIIRELLQQRGNLIRQTAQSKDSTAAQRLSPFRGRNAVYKTYQALFGRRLDPLLDDNEFHIFNLPHTAVIQQECQCSGCDVQPSRCFNGTCDTIDFYRKLAAITVDVLVVSLFDYPDLQICNDSTQDLWQDSRLHKDMVRLLLDPKADGVGVSDLLDRAMRLSGHNLKRLNEEDWVISSAKGQAVWPAIYETQSHIYKGYLSLLCHPGLLIHHGETYDMAIRSPGGMCLSPPRFFPEQVQKPCNLCPDLDLKWMASRGEHSLHISLGVMSGPRSWLVMGLSPYAAFRTLAKALITTLIFC
ncbi:hypothetical protein BKA59DRAFT_523359 [Fusarium tricinctum]|uniref:Uncharacterized protein n=1 Tax=Fusarium tricinctum TaxID=61284 RepID=A0A8K0WH08_9HYPO|nr:hypothetical protein BKA59DRAFT_523359 [Fusarium tricinctum]